MAASIVITYDTPPHLLADHPDTPLLVVVDDASKLGTHVRRHADAAPVPGVPGSLHVALKFILLLVGAVARLDGAPATAALRVFRGLFSEPWLSSVLSKLEAMGVFDAAVPSLEALVRRILTAVAKLAVYPREFIFSSMDFTESLTWAPGHFGPSPPWFVDLSFIHMGTTSQHTLLPLFTFIFECDRHYVRAQVTSTTGHLAYMAKAYLEQIEKYAGQSPGTRRTAHP